MFYAAFIAICSIVIAPPDCDKQHAVHWVVAPERQTGLAECFKFGEEYIAQTALVKLGETYPKIICQQMQAPE